MLAQEVVGIASGVEVQVFMAYDEADPWTVTFSFPTGDTITSWAFAREMLSEAMTGVSVGIGDVRVAVTGKELFLSLVDARNGEITVIIFPSMQVAMFLDTTERVVPVGSESDFIDIDGEWSEWCNEDSV